MRFSSDQNRFWSCFARSDDKLSHLLSFQNDLTTLQALIDKWRSCAQAALYELQSDVSIDGGRAGLSDLIDLFGLDDGILHFDRTEEDFTS